MQVHNPLNRESRLYRIYEAALNRDPPPGLDDTHQAKLLQRYRVHAVQLARLRDLPPPHELQQDDREFVQTFRRFFAELAAQTGFGGLTATVPFLFPQVPFSDGRADAEAVYVSSGKLDALELFAGTVSICARLNELAVEALVEIGEPAATDVVGLPWVALAGDVAPQRSIGSLLELGTDADLVAFELLGQDWTDSAVRRAAFARLSLSRCLAQLMMRAIRRGAESGWAAIPPLPDVQSPIDRRYLALLALTFVILHEVGHVMLRHHELQHEVAPEWKEATETIRAAFESDDPSETSTDFTGTGSSFEMAADSFALLPFQEKLHEPMLEAASLWCTVHEMAHVVAGNRSDDFLRMMNNPEAHPSFALRVWNMNRRLATEDRPPEVARSSVTAAENAAYEYERGTELPDTELWLYQTVLDLAQPALADEFWLPPTKESPIRAVLVSGVEAWEAGRAATAEAAFRRAIADDATGHAHYLLGRLLESQGAIATAVAEYESAEALGWLDGANDLGLLLERIHELDAAEAAFRRADDAGNLFGTYNLGRLLEARGDQAAALLAYVKADAAGHAGAAMALGHLAYDNGSMELAESAWRRADARGAENAATNLGLVLYQANDSEGAEQAWCRGADRGEPEACHNLAILLERQGRLKEAAAALTQAAALGRTSSEEDLSRVVTRISE